MVFERAFTSWWLGYSVVKAGLLNDLFGVGINGKVEEPKIVKPPPIKVIKPTVTVTPTFVKPTVTVVKPTVTVTPTFIKPPIKIHPKVITAVQQGIFEVSPSTQKQIVKEYKAQITDTKISETIVTQYGVGEVLSPGVIDYGVTPGASTVITVPSGMVETVQIAIDSGLTAPGTGQQSILTVQAEEEKFTKTQAEEIGVHATTFFNVMNQFGDHGFALGGSGLRDMRTIGGTNLPFTYVVPTPKKAPPPTTPTRFGGITASMFGGF